MGQTPVMGLPANSNALHCGLTVSFNLYNLGLIAAANRDWGGRHFFAPALPRRTEHGFGRIAPGRKARDALGGDAFDAAWAEGAELNTETAIAYALESNSEMTTRHIM